MMFQSFLVYASLQYLPLVLGSPIKPAIIQEEPEHSIREPRQSHFNYNYLMLQNEFRGIEWKVAFDNCKTEELDKS